MNHRTTIWILLATALLVAPATGHARWMNPNTGRFQTMDTYEGSQGEPLSLHKYLYCADNPVNRIDPSGLRVEIPDTAVRTDYDEAVNYLKKSPTATALVGAAADDMINTYRIVKAEGDFLYSPDWTESEYEPAVIHWAPRVAMKIRSSGEVLSPAVALVHELDHAYLHLALGYGETESKVIEFEKSCVAELRSQGEMEARRESHRDASDFYFVPSPSKRGPLGQQWHPKPGLSPEQWRRILTNSGPSIPYPRLADLGGLF